MTLTRIAACEVWQQYPVRHGCDIVLCVYVTLFNVMVVCQFATILMPFALHLCFLYFTLWQFLGHKHTMILALTMHGLAASEYFAHTHTHVASRCRILCTHTHTRANIVHTHTRANIVHTHTHKSYCSQPMPCTGLGTESCTHRLCVIGYLHCTSVTRYVSFTYDVYIQACGVLRMCTLQQVGIAKII